MDKTIDATIEMSRKGMNVIIGSFEENVYKLIS